MSQPTPPALAQPRSIRPNKLKAFTIYKKGSKVFLEAAQVPPKNHELPLRIGIAMVNGARAKDNVRAHAFNFIAHFFLSSACAGHQEPLHDQSACRRCKGVTSFPQGMRMRAQLRQCPSKIGDTNLWHDGCRKVLALNVERKALMHRYDRRWPWRIARPMNLPFGSCFTSTRWIWSSKTRAFSNTTFALKPSQTPTLMEIDAIRVRGPPTSMYKLSKKELKKKFGG